MSDNEKYIWRFMENLEGELEKPIKLLSEGGFKLHKEVLDPEDGRQIPYGNENVLTIYRIKQMLRDKGFKIDKISYRRFLPSFKLLKYFKILKTIENLLRKTPALKELAVGYTVIASRRYGGC